ncbi:MAG: metal-dependent transcriptional regulator [Eubacteriales bacterium]|nr:metal-dependent transcriptional regulator [Eubacteriales bacterium]
MNIHESAEDYLETILVLHKRLGQVRSIDIVNEMEFSKPSVSVAMKKLRENGYIEMDGNLYITLTDAGREIAERIYARHRLLKKVLTAIGVDEKTAAKEACEIEHHISEETYNCINNYYNARMGQDSQESE